MNTALLINHHSTGNIYKLDPPLIRVEGNLDKHNKIEDYYVENNKIPYLLIFQFESSSKYLYVPQRKAIERILKGEQNIRVDGHFQWVLPQIDCSTLPDEEILYQLGYSLGLYTPPEYGLYDEVLL